MAEADHTTGGTSGHTTDHTFGHTFGPPTGQIPSQRRSWGLLGLIALSTPMALAVESGMRRLLMPPDFERVRAWLSPTLTPWAWATVPLTVAATGLGWWLVRVLARRELRVVRRGMTAEQARRKADFEALMLASSAPQVPAVAATMLFMLGASPTPVVVSMVLATLGVLSLGVWVGRREAAPD
ncbi:hypothetical protein [Paraliomyxa miuraensis]|uniref:hypothetical protein n=1 Tax=Paraliomyxa miuraensis TaxID=376150 RepID=UPI0022570142|nr:hypothetical protein [Paraliomyxa miuraensis]MCX4246637.1 hypothetical protein [Paraliomyxa miuraensis]